MVQQQTPKKTQQKATSKKSRAGKRIVKQKKTNIIM